jgi:hypothetical protein
MIKNIDNKAVTKGLARFDEADTYLLSYYDDTLAMMKAGNLLVEETYWDTPLVKWDYSLSVCVLYGFFTILLTDNRHKPGYRYCPDQRPYTFRLLGKPAQGLSPPFPGFKTSPVKAFGLTKTQLSNLKTQKHVLSKWLYSQKPEV